MTTIYDVEITVKPTSQKTHVIAQAEVVFYGDIRVKGVRVLKSKYAHPRFKEQIAIKPPAYKNGFKWVEIIYIENQELWSEIEGEIYEKFKELNIKYDPLEVVNVDDMPDDLGSHI